MMYTIRNVDTIAKGLLLCTGTIIVEMCDPLAQNLLTQEKRDGKIDLSGKEPDGCCLTLVEGIIGS